MIEIWNIHACDHFDVTRSKCHSLFWSCQYRMAAHLNQELLAKIANLQTLNVKTAEIWVAQVALQLKDLLC